MMIDKNSFCIALDTTDLLEACRLTRLLRADIGFIKIGLEFFCAHGPEGYKRIAQESVPIFLDLKLIDIPNTITGALKALAQFEPSPAFITLHALGGSAMMQAARHAASPQTKLLAVTCLTSLSEDDLGSLGFSKQKTISEHVMNLAQTAKEALIDGVVCSPWEVRTLKESLGSGFLTMVPGIRPSLSDQGDQKRVATPQQALAEGADILVIGRPITQAADPLSALRKIYEGSGWGNTA